MRSSVQLRLRREKDSRKLELSYATQPETGHTVFLASGLTKSMRYCFRHQCMPSKMLLKSCLQPNTANQVTMIDLELLYGILAEVKTTTRI